MFRCSLGLQAGSKGKQSDVVEASGSRTVSTMIHRFRLVGVGVCTGLSDCTSWLGSAIVYRFQENSSFS